MALHQQLTIVQQGNDHHRAWVGHIFACGSASRRQANGISESVQKMTLEQLLAVNAVLDQVFIGHGSSQLETHRGPVPPQLPKVRTMAWAHKVIKPPGIKPSNKTKAPLMDKTTRTSKGADTVVAVKGGSKYITLTTRR